MLKINRLIDTEKLISWLPASFFLFAKCREPILYQSGNLYQRVFVSQLNCNACNRIMRLNNLTFEIKQEWTSLNPLFKTSCFRSEIISGIFLTKESSLSNHINQNEINGLIQLTQGFSSNEMPYLVNFSPSKLMNRHVAHPSGLLLLNNCDINNSRIPRPRGPRLLKPYPWVTGWENWFWVEGLKIWIWSCFPNHSYPKFTS